MTHSSNGDNLVKVVDVHVHKHSVETSKNLLACGEKSFWERSACKGRNKESNTHVRMYIRTLILVPQPHLKLICTCEPV